MKDVITWRPLTLHDLDSVNRIADSVHTTLPERAEVFEEKVRLFPMGCRILQSKEQILGYGISHPWMLKSLPPLDEFLRSLPESPECLYIHDIVVLPEARGHRSAEQYIDFIKSLAYDMTVHYLALVSVYGTDKLWARFGFHIVEDFSLNNKLRTYGATAKYMICDCR